MREAWYTRLGADGISGGGPSLPLPGDGSMAILHPAARGL
jgi:hypothetical protein